MNSRDRRRRAREKARKTAEALAKKVEAGKPPPSAENGSSSVSTAKAEALNR